jgi:phosphate butyryltransferase
MIKNFDQLLNEAKRISIERDRPVQVVLAAGHDPEALAALLEARELGLANGILVGDEHQIRSTLDTLNVSSTTGFEIISTTNETETAYRSIELIREKRAGILMKGKIKTAALLKAVLDKEKGLRTQRLMSDVFLFEFPARQENQLIMITDGGINLTPDLKQKAQLIENAVVVAHALGNSLPKVAVLSAVEVVNPDLPSTLDAAILTQMNRRGQIAGCVVDGPLALDNAISQRAVQEKGIDSPVAGLADILLCPNIECANMLAKGTTYFANLPLAHTCLGAQVPVLIPSRSDNARAKLLSIALSVVVSYFQEKA